MKKGIFKFILLLSALFCLFVLSGIITFNLRVTPINSAPNEPIINEAEKEYSPLGLLITNEQTSSAVCVYLDFNRKTTHIYTAQNKTDLKFPYTIDRYIILNEFKVKQIVDRFGGIVCKTDGEYWRYTGTQVTDMLYGGTTHGLNKEEILQAIFNAFATKGFSKEDFWFIINGSDTDISYVDFYNCSNVLNETFSNPIIYGGD